MTTYLLNLLVLLPLVAALAWGSLWLWNRAQGGGFGRPQRDRAVRVIDAVALGATTRLAVVEFGGRRHLLAVSRGRIDKIAEAGPADSFIDDGDEPGAAVDVPANAAALLERFRSRRS